MRVIDSRNDKRQADSQMKKKYIGNRDKFSTNIDVVQCPFINLLFLSWDEMNTVIGVCVFNPFRFPIIVALSNTHTHTHNIDRQRTHSAHTGKIPGRFVYLFFCFC